MSLKARVRKAEVTAAKNNGRFVVAVLLDNETDEQARTRLGIDDTAEILWISEQDAKL